MSNEPTAIQIHELRHRFDEMYRANHQMWACILELRKDQLTVDLGYPIGSIHAQLIQMIRNENLWINFLWHGEVEYLQEVNFPTLARVRLEWDALEAEIRDYLSTLTPTDVEHQVELERLNLPPLTLSDILLRIVNQTTKSRTQILLCIHQLCHQ